MRNTHRLPPQQFMKKICEVSCKNSNIIIYQILYNKSLVLKIVVVSNVKELFSHSPKKKKIRYFLFTQVSTFSLIIKIVYLELNSIANSLFYVKHYLFQ